MAEIVDKVDPVDEEDEVDPFDDSDQADRVDNSAPTKPRPPVAVVAASKPKPKPVVKAAAKRKPAANPAVKAGVKPAAKVKLPEPKPEPEYTGPRVFSAEVAALAILAAKRMHHRFHDENDNEAERQTDGSVRLSIKVSPEVGHERVWVRVPDQIELEVIATPEKISPE